MEASLVRFPLAHPPTSRNGLPTSHVREERRCKSGRKSLHWKISEGKGVRAEFDGAIVLLVRSGEQVFALGNRCTHQGAPWTAGR